MINDLFVGWKCVPIVRNARSGRTFNLDGDKHENHSRIQPISPKSMISNQDGDVNGLDGLTLAWTCVVFRVLHTIIPQAFSSGGFSLVG